MGEEQRQQRKIQILLIEDNPADVYLLRRAFAAAELECEVKHFEDGAEALAFVRGLEGDVTAYSPDLAILDLNLPKNDGVEVLQAIRASRAFFDVPVAVLSSSASPRERARIEQFGIGCYITKPADFDEFLKIGPALRELIDKRRGPA